MNCFVYEVYCERDAPETARVRLSEVEAVGALSTFATNLQLHLAYGGPNPAIEDPSEATVKVVVPYHASQRHTTIGVDTVIGELAADTAVGEVARSHGLLWKRIASRCA